MSSYEQQVRESALDTASKNMKLLQKIAGLAITSFGYDESQIVIVCAQYFSVWTNFIIECDPDAKLKAEELRRANKDPIHLSAMIKQELLEILRKKSLEIKFPNDHLPDGKMRLLVMCEVGYLWLQIFPSFERATLS